MHKPIRISERYRASQASSCLQTLFSRLRLLQQIVETEKPDSRTLDALGAELQKLIREAAGHERFLVRAVRRDPAEFEAAFIESAHGQRRQKIRSMLSQRGGASALASRTPRAIAARAKDRAKAVRDAIAGLRRGQKTQRKFERMSAECEICYEWAWDDWWAGTDTGGFGMGEALGCWN